MQQEQLFLWMVRAIVMVTALPIHECAHALVASRLGDNTARDQGRLSLNPFLHLDLFGSILLIFAGFGWAKPVPIDMRNFKHPRRGMALSALAGPMANILLGYILICVYKLVGYLMLGYPPMRGSSQMLVLLMLLYNMVFVNLYLAVFNLLPIPPLDGSKIIGGLLPEQLYYAMLRYERYIAIVVFAMIWFGMLSGPLSIIADRIFTGLDFLSRPVDLLFS